ncbi:hypothetical protein AK830_g129 [Neonectria ditissima]|uniref:Uncharacterized protein n=1 Tax=Neonectria ditissima TaxID=78410 RepID=A0A0P7C3L3_9HYPO|nr:hypothetical protein AK830_g129 [Neonectria ditissima]
MTDSPSSAPSSLPVCNSHILHNIPSSEQLPLSSTLSRRLANVDSIVARAHRVVESRDGHEITLLFLGEATRVLAVVLGLLDKIRPLHPTTSTHNFIKVVSKLQRRALPFTTFAHRTSSRLHTLVDILDEWQIMTRMWGLFDMLVSVKGLFHTTWGKADGECKNMLDSAVIALQTISMTSFHICEAAACLSQARVLVLSPKLQERFMSWAARSWAAFIFIELGRLLLEWSRKPRGAEVDGEWLDEWKKEVYRNLAWAPVTLHWSFPDGLLSDMFVALFALYPSFSLMKDFWKETA